MEKRATRPVGIVAGWPTFAPLIMRLPHLSRFFSKGGHRRPRLYVLSAQLTPGIPQSAEFQAAAILPDTIVRSPHPSKIAKRGAAESCDDAGNDKN